MLSDGEIFNIYSTNDRRAPSDVVIENFQYVFRDILPIINAPIIPYKLLLCHPIPTPHCWVVGIRVKHNSTEG